MESSTYRTALEVANLTGLIVVPEELEDSGEVCLTLSHPNTTATADIIGDGISRFIDRYNGHLPPYTSGPEATLTWLSKDELR